VASFVRPVIAKVEKIRESAKKLDIRGSAFKTGLEVENSY
jgi:hypothetical protein